MLTLPLETTFQQLQEAIEKELGIPPTQQKIRFGFPPRELQPPDVGSESEPVPLQHGDRVTVECLKPAQPLPQPDDVSMPAEELQHAPTVTTAAEQWQGTSTWSV